jgi:hypothetical protein
LATAAERKVEGEALRRRVSQRIARRHSLASP